MAEHEILRHFICCNVIWALLYLTFSFRNVEVSLNIQLKERTVNDVALPRGKNKTQPENHWQIICGRFPIQLFRKSRIAKPELRGKQSCKFKLKDLPFLKEPQLKPKWDTHPNSPTPPPFIPLYPVSLFKHEP